MRVMGRNCFHVKLISLSYRIRGYAPRAQINRTLIAVRGAINIMSLIKVIQGTIVNSAAEIIPIKIMFMYSAIKMSAKVPDLNSVLNPDTSSDSPSARSNGVRLVSAKEVIIHVVINGHNRNIN
jgi:hypothetical protein